MFNDNCTPEKAAAKTRRLIALHAKALGLGSNGADMRAAYREAAARIDSRRGVATHAMISAVAASGEDAEAGGRRRRAANPIQAIAIPAAIQPISP
jgi:hypothetical protein